MLRAGGRFAFLPDDEAQEVMARLATKGREPTKRLRLKHGAREPLYGVQIADLKVIAKKLKGRQDLALELFATGNGDAQYLAGMIADGRLMTKTQLDRWAKRRRGTGFPARRSRGRRWSIRTGLRWR